MYQVMATQGQGGVCVAKYTTLGWALRYVERHKGEGSFAIIYPNGEYHKWKD